MAESRYITRWEAQITRPNPWSLERGWNWQMRAYASHRGEAYLLSSGCFTVVGDIPPEDEDALVGRCFEQMREAYPQLAEVALRAPAVDEP